MNTLIKQQRGVTFGGFIIFIILLALAAIFTMKLIPAYLDSAKVQKAFVSIARDPGMQAATIAEIKQSFTKRAVIMDNVSDVSVDDIEINKEGGTLSLSASYSKKIPLVGNVSLLLEFNPSSK